MVEFKCKSGKGFLIKNADKLAIKLAMLIEGECCGRRQAMQKYGYTENHYYVLLRKYQAEGSQGLLDKKTGPKKNTVRTEEVTRQIIRELYLDPDSSAKVVAQKLKQSGYNVSLRSVERTITEYGLQKKLTTRTLRNRKRVKR